VTQFDTVDHEVLNMWILQNSKMVATAILKNSKIAEIIEIRDCGGHHFEQELSSS